MSVKQTSIYVVRMRFATITWDHTTAAAVLGTLEMDKPVLVIVKFLLIECYYIFFFVVMSIIVLRFFLHKGVEKKQKNKRNSVSTFRKCQDTIIKEWIQVLFSFIQI